MAQGVSPDRIVASFGAHAAFARHIIDALGGDPAGTDGSHDMSHLLRVWRNAEAIARTEPGCDLPLLVAAVLFHDCVAVEKNSPHRAAASRLSAARAIEIVGALGWDAHRAKALGHAIETHSFASGLAPKTVEARILRDADKLDAIGAIGIARCFYVAGRMATSLYDAGDFDAANRELDDQRYAIDHFRVKLFPVAEGFHTRAGQAMAVERSAVMRRFVDSFRSEVEA
jgi:uncharacterized protein